MQRLSQEAYEKARSFLKTEARPLERVVFEYEFEQGTTQHIFEELRKFQNSDGGFGHGLEPDVRCDASSALATTIALQTLSTIREADEAMLSSTLHYLENTYIPEQKGWDIIPRIAEESPRAFWWEYGAFLEHWGNPNAEIAGYLLKYRDMLRTEWVDQVVADAKEHLQNTGYYSEMHEMLCYVRFADQLPHEEYANIAPAIDRFIAHCVVADPELRAGYCAVPLQILQSPNSRYYDRFAKYLAIDLDQLVQQQGEDGAWAPNWSWGRFDAEWQQARQDWKGVLTLNHLRTLRAFERIEFN